MIDLVILQGLQDKIKLVPIDLQNRPAWYKEKVYPENKVFNLLIEENKLVYDHVIDHNFLLML